MTDVLLFHHAQGLTPGVHALADRLRAAGHRVTVPDLYDGRTFASLDDGVAHAQELGDAVAQRAGAAAQQLPQELVYAGISLGVMPAMQLAQTRPGARGAVLLSGCAPADHFAPRWPDGVPLQLHTREADDWGDADVAAQVAAEVEGAELFLYGGEEHLFLDESLPAYDPADTELVVRRVLDLLARVG